MKTLSLWKIPRMPETIFSSTVSEISLSTDRNPKIGVVIIWFQLIRQKILSFHSAVFREAKQIIHTLREFMMGKELKFDRWGYEVNTSSDACLSAINSYYLEVYFWIHAYFFLVKQNDFCYYVMLEMNEFMNFWFLGS